MSNPVFKYHNDPAQPSSVPDQNGSHNPMGQTPNFEQLFEQFKQNPDKYLGNCNFPPDVQTPEQRVRYLAANNRIPPLIQRQVYDMLAKMGKN